MKYITKLDGVRAFAILSIVSGHYVKNNYLSDFFGSLDLQLLFAISGFLITKNLISSKAYLQDKNKSKTYANFIIRRTLRIYPAYYALLFTYLVLGINFENGSFWTCFLYVFNIHQAIDPTSKFQYLGHLWTLSMQEQFYLIWPLFIIFAPSKHVTKITLTFFILAPLFRGFLSTFDLDYLSIRNLTISQMDSMCGGALVALFQSYPTSRISRIWKKHTHAWLFAGILVWVLAAKVQINNTFNISFALFGASIICMFIIDFIVNDKFPKLTAFCNYRPLRFIGKISYGIYLFQFLSIFPLYKLMTLIGNPEWINQPVVFAFIWTIITILIATVSWYFFEAPVSRLKKHFEYKS
jgi:peptidoglycan/LPS O-acetylase OafA/YrhL